MTCEVCAMGGRSSNQLELSCGCPGSVQLRGLARLCEPCGVSADLVWGGLPVQEQQTGLQGRHSPGCTFCYTLWTRAVDNRVPITLMGALSAAILVGWPCACRHQWSK